jgi:hypothetical protein
VLVLEGIQAILNNEKPDTFYESTTLFMQIVSGVACENRTTLGARKCTLMDYAMARQAAAHENMLGKARQAAAAPSRASAPALTETPAPAPPVSGGIQSLGTQVREVPPNLA